MPEGLPLRLTGTEGSSLVAGTVLDLIIDTLSGGSFLTLLAL